MSMRKKTQKKYYEEDVSCRSFQNLSELIESDDHDKAKIKNKPAAANYFVFGKSFPDKNPICNLNSIPWAFCLINGSPCDNKIICQREEIYNAESRQIYHNGYPCGFTYRDGCGSFLRLSGIVPPDKSQSPANQAESLFESLSELIENAGFKFSDVVRTWFYNKDILSWYKEFNEVRTRFFERQNIFAGIVPASTGIGAENPFGTAASVSLIAFKPADGVAVKSVSSPLQCPATNYKSSFSRALEIDCPEHKKLFISGTASINEKGDTVYLENTEKQIEKTMEVIEAILKSRGLDWGNISRGIAYFKNKKDIPLFDAFLKKKNIPPFPCLNVEAVICRENLLFELEADAIYRKNCEIRISSDKK